MTEKILTERKNGMAVLLADVAFLIISIIAIVRGAIILDGDGSPALMIIGIIAVSIGWIPLCGLRILQPQEALVVRQI